MANVAESIEDSASLLQVSFSTEVDSKQCLARYIYEQAHFELLLLLVAATVHFYVVRRRSSQQSVARKGGVSSAKSLSRSKIGSRATTTTSAAKASGVEAADASQSSTSSCSDAIPTAIVRSHLQKLDLASALDAVRAMRTAGAEPNSTLWNELLDATVKVGQDSQWIIDEIKACGQKPNHITCSILLKGVQHNTPVQEVNKIMDLVDQIEDIDEILLSSVIEACVRTNQTDLLRRQLQKRWGGSGTGATIARNAHTYGSIVRAYGVLRDTAGIWNTWKDMRAQKIPLTSITLGCMVEALTSNKEVEAGHRLIRELLVEPDSKSIINAVIFCSVIKGYSHERRFENVWAAYEEMLANGIELTIATFNALVDACARCGQMARVSSLLEEMMKKDVAPNLITFSTILKGYCNESKLDKAFELLESMKSSTTFVPDEIMFNSLIDGCARKGLWQRGFEVFNDMEASGVPPTNYTLSLLVKLLGRGRQLDRAFKLCKELPALHGFKPNVHVYGNLVHACVIVKNFPRAIEVFVTMAQEKVRPDERCYQLLIRALLASGDTYLDNAIGLLRAAVGLRDVLPELAIAGSTAASPILQPHGGVSNALVAEVLEAAVDGGYDKTAILLGDLQRKMPKLHVDPKLKLRAAAKFGL
jgi:pentatricopeptide repeat protein